ncbi:MAG: hypothetical protein H7Y27_06595 [Gemmatimonadaceae bacterium]|nr:hypothetical protein [Chitinophagaceae bacterium]
MKTLAICLNKLVQNGYKEHFKATDSGFYCLDSNRTYSPEHIQIVNFFRFASAPGSVEPPAVMYVIEADDGAKGVLVDRENKLGPSELMIR